jgi:ribosome maturation factor RimP
MQSSPLEQKIEQIVGPSLDALGFAVVMLRVGDGMKSKALQVFAERKDGSSVNVDDCVAISRTVSALLEVDDPITGAYHLEVSSPGIDRPLMNAHDFERFAGHEAKVELALPVAGRKRFRGVIVKMEEGAVVLQVDNEEHALELENIRQAKLVLTDALIAMHQKKRKAS